MITATEFYRKLRTEQLLNDYAGLAQSERSTAIRHRGAVEWIGTTRVLFDCGCGTGLILEAFAQARRPPALYVAVDMFFECGQAALERAQRLGVDAVYLHKPERVPFELLFDQMVMGQALVAIGVLGTGRYRGLAEVASFINDARITFCSGYVTVPLAFEGAAVEAHLARFPRDELEAALGAISAAVDLTVNGPHEAALYWRDY